MWYMYLLTCGNVVLLCYGPWYGMDFSIVVRYGVDC